MTGRLLLDEMYPPALAEVLGHYGRDALAVAGLEELAGSPDTVILETASGAEGCLVTENVRDFAVLIRHASHSGVLFVNAQRWPGLAKGTDAPKPRARQVGRARVGVSAPSNLSVF